MERLVRKEQFNAPVKVMQFGEGNFLRAFVDWMIQQMNQKAGFNGAVRLVQPLEKGMGDVINEQGGLYTVILRGVQDGKVVENSEVIQCVKDCLNPVRDWDKVIETAKEPTLRFVFSNTTEAGIEYKAGVNTFPAKVAKVVAARAETGLPGLIFIPCELIEHNGDKLKEYVIRYLEDDGNAAAVKYVKEQCIFCNTLVDRIVAGYPRGEGEAQKYWEKFGYEDRLLDCAEPFFFFVIEGPAEVEKELPAKAAGVNVLFTDDQTPYRTRKVRFLNGAHTASVLAAHMAGFTFVDEMVRDPEFGKFLKQVLFEEVFPTVQLPDAAKKAYAESIFERFANPYAQHRLLSIALNSVSKWKVRVLPTLLDYLKMTGKLPVCLTKSMGSLIKFYRTCEINDSPEVKEFFAKKPSTREILANVSFWGMDLNTIPGFTAAVEAEAGK